VSRKAIPAAPASAPDNANPDATPSERAPSPFNRFYQAPRQSKRPAEPSGRVLPPAPSWMRKPLKPPGRAQSNG